MAIPTLDEDERPNLPLMGCDPYNAAVTAEDLKERGRRKLARAMELARSEYFLLCFWAVAERSRIVYEQAPTDCDWREDVRQHAADLLALYRLVRDGQADADWYFTPPDRDSQRLVREFMHQYGSHLFFLRPDYRRHEELQSMSETELFYFLLGPKDNCFASMGLEPVRVCQLANPQRELPNAE